MVYKNSYFVNLQDRPKAPKTFGRVFFGGWEYSINCVWKKRCLGQ